MPQFLKTNDRKNISKMFGDHSSLFVFSVRVFAAGFLSDGAAHAAGGAASAAAVASAFLLFAPFHDGNDGENCCRKDDRRKHEGDGEPRARQLGGLKLCA